MYCTKCGKQNNEGTKFCVGCGSPMNSVEGVSNNSLNNQNVKQMPKKYGYGKCILISFGLAFAFFFIFTLISVLINLCIIGNGQSVDDVSPLLKILLKGILPILQIMLPMFMMFFGHAVIYLIKNRKNL